MWHNWIQLDHASSFSSSNEVSAIKILSKTPRDVKNHWLLTPELPILWPENKNTCAAFQKQHNLPTVLANFLAHPDHCIAPATVPPWLPLNFKAPNFRSNMGQILTNWFTLVYELHLIYLITL